MSHVYSLCRLDEMVRSKEDSEYYRLSYYNKGLKLLKETLESEKTQHKGELPAFPSVLLCIWVHHETQQ